MATVGKGFTHHLPLPAGMFPPPLPPLQDANHTTSEDDDDDDDDDGDMMADDALSDWNIRELLWIYLKLCTVDVARMIHITTKGHFCSACVCVCAYMCLHRIHPSVCQSMLTSGAMCGICLCAYVQCVCVCVSTLTCEAMCCVCLALFVCTSSCSCRQVQCCCPGCHVQRIS